MKTLTGGSATKKLMQNNTYNLYTKKGSYWNPFSF